MPARGLVVIVALVCLASEARAHVADVADTGCGQGRAGAVSAVCNDGAAAYYNPAGLAFRELPMLSLGGLGLFSDLHKRGARVPLSAPVGGVIELATPVPLGEPLTKRLFVGVWLYVPPEQILLVRAPTTTEPFLPYYENRSQRLALMPALAVRLLPGLAVGLGLNYFGGLDGDLVGSQDRAGRLQFDVDERIPTRVVPHAGIRWDIGAFSLAAAFRARDSVPINTRNTTDLDGQRLTVDVRTGALFTPETWVLGGAFRHQALELSVDLSWRRWSHYVLPYSHVHAATPSFVGPPGEGLVIDTRLERPETHDVPRVAVALAWHGAATLSAGYAFEPTAFAQQPGPTNLLDGDKHILGLGAEVPLTRVERARLSLAISGEAQWMRYVRYTKQVGLLVDEDPTRPGLSTTNLGYPSVAAGGLLLAGQVSVRLELEPE